jgi:hypothetical protein
VLQFVCFGFLFGLRLVEEILLKRGIVLSCGTVRSYSTTLWEPGRESDNSAAFGSVELNALEAASGIPHA